MPEITIVLHNIRSTFNVGSILRTAEGFGVKRAICTGYTPYPAQPSDTRLPHIRDKITAQIHKTALDAEVMVPVEHYETLDEWLAQNTLPIVALEQATNSVTLGEYIPPARFVLLLGEEVHGIEQRYIEQCDAIVEIPMVGQKESFNVSVATGIALYALSL